MDRYDYLIIGGGIAGVTAAETIREEDPHASIGVISDEPHVLYSRVLLPAYLKKKIPREKLFLRTTDEFIQKDIDLRLEEFVVEVDVRKKQVELANRSFLGYEKLCIASGGRVKEWGNPEDQDAVFRLQTLDDADRLHEHLPQITQPLVIGSSFISLEFLEIFVSNRITPRVVIRTPYFFGNALDLVGGEILAGVFQQHGVTMHTEDSVIRIGKGDERYEAETAKGKKLACDAFAVGVGIERNLDCIRGSGVEMSEQGVRTNEFLETNVEGVYAAGDVAECYDALMGGYRAAGNWTNAFLQGKRVGLNMAGKREAFRSVSAYSITNFGMQITMLGDVSDAGDTIVRFERTGKHDSYERLFLRSGAIVGAVLLNRFQDKRYLTKLIETKTPIEEYRDRLNDFQFDISTIPVVP